MRVVFDSNVLIAAFATHGLCHSLLEICLRGHEIVLSDGILDEVSQKLGKKVKAPAATVREVRAFLETHCLVERPVPVPSDACRDPKDLPILGLAAAARAACLITGDEDLLVIGKYHESSILTPRQLYDRLRGR